jgi:hypothetical protein
VNQNALHPDLVDMIRYRVFRERIGAPKVLKQGWRYLLPAREALPEPYSRKGFELDAIIKTEGWTALNFRTYGEYARPTPMVSPGWSSGTLPPIEREKSRLRDLIKIEVTYPKVEVNSEIQSDLRKRFIEVLRENLRHAINFEKEIGSFFVTDLAPIIADTDKEGDSYRRGRGRSARMIVLANQFEQLVSSDQAAAQREFFAWPVDDDTAFCRLRIWACRFRTIIGPQDVVDVITSLSTESFWNARHQRDLLLSLQDRWNDLSEQQKQRIEARILGGRKRWRRASATDFRERRIHAILERLLWLKDNGCNFTFDIAKYTKVLETQLIEWNPKWA